MSAEDEKPDLEPQDDDSERTNPFNPVALFFIAVLLIGGWVMIDRLRGDSSTQDCIQSGKRNCARLEDDRVAAPPDDWRRH